jgi:hypothetical protein
MMTMAPTSQMMLFMKDLQKVQARNGVDHETVPQIPAGAEGSATDGGSLVRPLVQRTT